MITLDGYAASHRAVAQLKEVGTLPRRLRIRSSQYLNNVVEQDHRRIKQRIGADARIQAIRDGGRDDPWHRVSREDQEKPIQPQTADQKTSDRSSALGGGSGGIEPRKSFCQNEHPFIGNCTRTLGHGFGKSGIPVIGSASRDMSPPVSRLSAML